MHLCHFLLLKSCSWNNQFFIVAYFTELQNTENIVQKYENEMQMHRCEIILMSFEKVFIAYFFPNAANMLHPNIRLEMRW